MKNTNFRTLRFLTLFTVLAGGAPLFADDTLTVQWREFCQTVQERQVEITTTAGETVSGYCVSINANEVDINHGGKIVKLGRAVLSKIRVDREKGGQTRKLGHMLHSGLKEEASWLLSPSAIGGIVSIPPTIAWGAVSVPFCLLGDLLHHAAGKQEVKLI